MKYSYNTGGTCSRRIEFELNPDGTVGSLQFFGGCHGNLQGISALIEGMPAQEAIRRLSGIRCGAKDTSCPDQLAQALSAAINSK